MKSILLNTTRTLASLLAAGLLTTLAVAAEAPAPGRPDPNAGDRVRGQAMRMGGLNLDERQRQLFREAMQKHREKMAALGEKLRAAQAELMQTILSDKYDEKNVRQKAEAVSKLQTELTVLRAEAFATVVPTLTPEQREQLQNSPMGAAMLGGGGMDFGGRRDREGNPAPPRGERGAP